MVRRKVVTVYQDEPNPGNDNIDDGAHNSSPPRKRTRLSKEHPTKAEAPKARRVALKEKVANPSSSDASFLRPVEEHESFHEKLGKFKTKLGSETITGSNLVIKNTSPLQEASITGSLVHQKLSQQLPVKDLHELVFLMKKDAAQGAADLIAKRGCWFPELLNCFRASDVTILDLSSPMTSSGIYIPEVPAGLTLKVLFQQHQFDALTEISLRNTPLLNDDIAFLRLIPSLTVLDISGTGVGTQSLHHLVCHRHTLRNLNLSHNPSIDDESRVALSAFPHLTSLYLRGTSLTMPGLRRLILNDLNKSCRLLSLPTHINDYLNTRHERYMVDIPTGYVQDPSLVGGMTVPNLKKNLELHAKTNKDVQVTGTKVELVSRLSTILSNRIADVKIWNVLGRAKE